MAQKITRPTKTEYLQRLEAIQEWIAAGTPSARIIHQIMASGWAKSRRNALYYYNAAQAQTADDDPEEKRRKWLAELKAQLRQMDATHCGTPNGMRASLAIIKEICKLEGLYKNEDNIQPPLPAGGVPAITIMNPHITGKNDLYNFE